MLSNRLSLWGILLTILLGTSVASAEFHTEDVVRVYLDTELSVVNMPAAVTPDTVTAYVALENPTLSGNLTSFRFYLVTRIGTITEVRSDLGSVVPDGTNYWRLTTDNPVPLTPTMLLAEFRVAIDGANVDHLTVKSADYWTESGEQTGATHPYQFQSSAWINTGTPEIRMGVNPIVFPVLGTNQTLEKQATIYNDGDAPLFTYPQFGAACEAFTLTNPTMVEIIPPLSSVPIRFIFAPPTPGDYQCQFDLVPSISISLQGAAQAPVTSLSGPAELDFGAVAIGGFADLQIELVNDGNYDVTIAPNEIAFCENFSIHPNTFPTTIPPGQSRIFVLYYEPTDLELQTCAVTFGDTLHTVQLSGSGKTGTLAAHVSADTVHIYAGAGASGGDLGVAWLTLYNDGDVYIYPSVQLIDPDGVFEILSIPQARIDPGRHDINTVGFTPDANQTYNARFQWGDGLPEVVLIGHGLLPYPALQTIPETIVFPPTNPGEQSTVTFSVFNSGNTSLSVVPSSNSPLVVAETSSNYPKPGTTFTITATYTPVVYGEFSFRILLNLEHEFYADCVAPPRYDFAADQNRLGVFFDPGLSDNEITVPAEPQALAAYLVLSNPSDTAGINGWQCRIEPSVGASLIGATLTGGMIDADSDIHEFVVGFSPSPLPYEPAVLLSTLQFVIWDVSVTDFAISTLPNSSPAIPGLMTWTTGVEGAAAVPMLAATGQPEVAWVHLNSSPSATQQDEMPLVTRLLPNVPNPFNPVTEIHFELTASSPVRIAVYDLSGRRVRTLIEGHLPAGAHHQVWNGRDDHGRTLASGAYYVRMVAGTRIDRRKVMLVK